MGNGNITRKGFIYSRTLGVLELAGCSSSSKGENDGSKTSDGTFALRGAFLVEPTEELVRLGIDFSSIPDTRKLVICVYDITNSTKKNWDAYPSCSMLFGSENEYEIDSFELPPRKSRPLSAEAATFRQTKRSPSTPEAGRSAQSQRFSSMRATFRASACSRSSFPNAVEPNSKYSQTI